ncbi:MAG: PilZ domain-containing protein [Spirochaetales bacterium]|jgi:hypothetical protein|nr:PilZ domain-containing protein [Spirochaetales bacterium]
MLFSKKQKQKEKDEEAIAPRAPRYNSLAAVRINGFEGMALLKNISMSGFCMQSKTFADFTPGEKYDLTITPESSTSLRPIEMVVQARWIRSEVSRFEVGFQAEIGFHVANAAANRELERYIEYLKIHSHSEK